MNNPTAIWIFHCFWGIPLLILEGAQEVVINLNEHYFLILNILGENYKVFYL